MNRIRLVNWRLIRLDDHVHFNGRVEGTTRGRISSQIVALDLEGMEGMTQSGNVYELVGPSATDDLAADAVLQKWMDDYGLSLDDIEILVVVDALH